MVNGLSPFYTLKIVPHKYSYQVLTCFTLLLAIKIRQSNSAFTLFICVQAPTMLNAGSVFASW